MDSVKRLHENISAMADGELPDSETELTLAALTGAEGQAAWEVYHLVGDVLRSDARGAGLSGDFGARLAARLAAEPQPDTGVPGRSGAHGLPASEAQAAPDGAVAAIIP